MAIHSSTEERFWQAVQQSPSGCWLWTRHTTRAHLRIQQRGKWTSVPAHRWAYEAYRGAVPEGMVLKRTCPNPRCVAPHHRRLVTRGQLVSAVKWKGYRGYESAIGSRFHHRVGLALFAD